MTQSTNINTGLKAEPLKTSVELDDLENFEEGAITALLLYFTLVESDPYRARLEEFRKLSDWLVDNSPMVKLYEETEDFHWPTLKRIDICAICYIKYGITQGGRVREGCPYCRGTVPFLTTYRYQIRDILYINDAHLEYLLADALYLWTKDKARKPITVERADSIEGTSDLEELETDATN